MRLPNRLSSLLLLAALSATSAKGALLVNESFDNYSGTGSALSGTAASATGLTGSWTAGATNTLTAGGLQFSTYSDTTGNRVAVDFGTGGSQLRVQTSFTTTVAAGTTVWSSYLVNYSTISSTAAALSEVRLSATEGGTGGSAWFRSFGNSNEATGNTFSGIAYDSSLVTAVAGNGSSALTTGVTYMVLSSYTNVGGAGGGTATQWVLTETQYASFRDSGFDLANLTARTAGTGSDKVFSLVSDTDAASKSFASGSYIQIAGNSDKASYDNLRYATTLQEVVSPVPEPSIAALLFLGSAAVFRRRR